MKNNTTIRWILIVLLGAVGLYLVVDHGQYLIPYLPFSFLFGCLVMHLFMHGGHGGHHHKDGDMNQDHQGHESQTGK